MKNRSSTGCREPSDQSTPNNPRGAHKLARHLFFQALLPPSTLSSSSPGAELFPSNQIPPQPQSTYCTHPDAIGGGWPRARGQAAPISSGGLGLRGGIRILPAQNSCFGPSRGCPEVQHPCCLSVFPRGAFSQHGHRRLSAPRLLLAGGELLLPTAGFCSRGGKNKQVRETAGKLQE